MPVLVPRALARSLALAGCLSLSTLISTSLAPVRAQSGEERVELIMEGLPPAGSPEYKALIKFAGDAKGQVLSLTKCEMWSVRPSLLERLKAEAAKKNVTVRVLDKDWNKVLEPMAPAQSMPGQVKSMMDQAMQSPSTAGVGMMSARSANMVEYALTKGMDAKGEATHPMSIKIAVNDKTSVTAVRRSVEIKGNRCIWRGVVEGTENPVTIMWWASGKLTGTIHHNDRLYQLKHMGTDMIGIVETMSDKMPEEHARTRPERMRQMNMQEDSAFMKGDASLARPKRGETQNLQDAASGSVRGAFQGIRQASEPSSRKKKGKAAMGASVNIDIMVAFTGKAASHYSDIKQDLIELAVEEAQESFRASGIKNVALRLVHVHRTDYDEAGAEHFDHVWRMVDKDGFMDEIPRLRDEKKADVVMLIVDDGQGCGLATRVAAEADEAYAVVHHECAATTYSLAHELGHLLGARHDRLLDKSTMPFAFGHGFIDPKKQWRTMMSYKAGCDGCPRLPIWSSPVSKVKNVPAGDELHDNARVIREQAERVARFR